MNNKCVCIFGPTASGKTKMAIEVAKKFNGVIISFDSMQIYRDLNIGTAKPSPDELNEADFRLVDFLPINETFSTFEFKKEAEKEIDSVLKSGKLPILCGGTGMYFDAVINNTDFGEFQIDENIRTELLHKSETPDILLDELKRIDPDSAEKLHTKDVKRIVRALEVYYSTGKTLTQFKNESHLVPSKYDFLLLELSYSDRAVLYDRIEKRVDIMLENGLLDETKMLIDKGILNSKTAFQAIAYKEMINYLNGEETLESAVNTLKTKSRNYAKRQITWFKKYNSVKIFMDIENNPENEIFKYVTEYLEEKQ